MLSNYIYLLSDEMSGERVVNDGGESANVSDGENAVRQREERRERGKNWMI